ncbi:MAG: NAD(P)H-hydrate dehydratase [Leptolyngbyaceae cyanobacterium CSU_1_3]|nr:NAD(P)H-hydrate dehydratase [Leptolyngbyaceae cyanobacterium CSU_1_3]
MRSIESRIFAAGMPVAALMEKVAGRIADRIASLYPRSAYAKVGVLSGPGHNGADALVVARELHFRGYEVSIFSPFAQLKDLTATHLSYAKSLGLPCHTEVDPLQNCSLLIDGLFGFGLERSLTDPIAAQINQVNQWKQTIVSIDLPSGLHTDTGNILETAICADRTLCLGLWKQGLLQDPALAAVGQAELIDFDIPLADIWAVLGDSPPVQRGTTAWALATLPLSRPPTTHKYKMGHLLLICGSRKYAGGALLSGLGARSSGVGMLSIAVPDSLKLTLSSHLPEALIIGCPETSDGAISELPSSLILHPSSFATIACGPGLTLEAGPIVQQVLSSECPLILDADGLNLLAQNHTLSTLRTRRAQTILTPHWGEFQRLFPDLSASMQCRVTTVREAAQQSGAIVLLKGARVTISDPQGQVRINPESTPALARGGSGDVLTGLIGGLLAQRRASQAKPLPLIDLVQAAAWWHAHAGILAAQDRTALGVDAHTLAQFLIPALRSLSNS